MNIQEQIAVMQHYANGGKVEKKEGCRHYNYDKGMWVDASPPAFNFEFWDYRIKKEPRKFHIGKYNLGFGVSYYILDNPSDPSRVNNTLPVEIITVTEDV